MKNKIFLIFCLLLLFNSCLDNRAPCGINTYIYYAEGNCNITNQNIKYMPYTGKVYIAQKQVAEQFADSSFDSLKKIALVTKAVRGGISLLVEPGTYYIIPDTMFCLNCNNMVTINKDDLIEKEFKFLKCISN